MTSYIIYNINYIHACSLGSAQSPSSHFSPMMLLRYVQSCECIKVHKRGLDEVQILSQDLSYNLCLSVQIYFFAVNWCCTPKNTHTNYCLGEVEEDPFKLKLVYKYFCCHWCLTAFFSQNLDIFEGYNL